MDHDLVIRNALIVDGTGKSSFVGDIAIHDGLITHVGDFPGTAVKEIDADQYMYII
jgi:N-acyl-D-aspartate/D-glutamate deacylase